MKRLALALILGAVALSLAPPASARVYVGVGVGGCCYGGYYGRPFAPYYGYGPYYSPYYGAPGYYYPPEAPPTVVYEQAAPAPAPYVVQQQAGAPPASIVPPDQPAYAGPPSDDGRPTFKDSKGRTCRKFSTVVDGSTVEGTVCKLADGSWRSVEE